MIYSIMVVDDSPFILEVVEAFLKENRYEVTCFSSPNAALEALAQKRFDCILSDFFMPEMNGDRFFREVRITVPDIPFIFMSTNEDIRVAIELMKMGADDYITKPIIKDVLLYRIEKTLKEYRNMQILERACREQNRMQGRIDLIRRIDMVDPVPEKTECTVMAGLLDELCSTDLRPAAQKYNRTLVFRDSAQYCTGTVMVDRKYLMLIITELFWNAVKYSPDESEISIACEFIRQQDSESCMLIMRNRPRLVTALDPDGRQINGIPAEYGGLVFELFFRLDDMEALDEEEWSGGTGLYIARKILGRQGAAIQAGNTSENISGETQTVVELRISLPLTG
ncbi:MAG: response regulator [Spirochaetales bacterium]|nr:response regulator [Spirochaetales bacterium]